MGQRIVWTKVAVEDLQEIRDYIARDSEQNAASVIEQILDAVELSADFPLIGRIVPEYDDAAIRKQIVYSYRIVYRVRSEDLTVIGIIHGARRLKRALRGRRI
jgi:addiction module RelE/StbE family toxin